MQNSQSLSKLWLALTYFLGVAQVFAQSSSAPPATPAPAAASAAALAAGSSSREPSSVASDLLASDKEGSIADTDVKRVLDGKQDLYPKKGFEDIFLTKDSSAVLDINKLDVDIKDLCRAQTNVGIIAAGEKDSSGGYRVVAGKTTGSTQILVYDGKSPECTTYGQLLKVYRITVSNDDLIGLLQEIRALLGMVEGLEIRIVGSQVVVDGQVLVPKDMRRVLAVLSKYQSKPVVNLVEVSPLTMKLLGEKMQEEIAGGKDRPPNITVKVLNGRFFLDGSVDKRVERDTAEKICQSYVSERYTLEPNAQGGKLEKPSFPGLGECVMMVRIRAGQPQDPDPIVSVRVDFVTLNRNYLRNFDFRWAPGVDLQGGTQYQSDTGKFLSTFTGTLANLFPKLDSAAQHGHARILKSATVLVRDGDAPGGGPDEATLTETLNVGYVIPGTGTNPPQPASTPVTTSIVVKARSISGSDKINLGVKATQTEIRDQTKGAPPTTLANTVDTRIVVINGESAALGGLIAERRNVSFGRAPASDGSIKIFDLDRVHNFTDEKSQFIIFVTPTKLRSTTEGTEVLKRKFRLRK